MPSLGTTVLYTGKKPNQFALVTADHGGGNLDLAVWEGESWAPKLDVPRGDDGAGHTWQPVSAE